MMTDGYTVITFAPVQGFIETSRKLRDLFGSSYLLSLLSGSVMFAVSQHGYKVVSPADINNEKNQSQTLFPSVIQGLPNQIVVEGNVSEEFARQAFDTAWSCIVRTCRKWIETRLQQKVNKFYWKREWGLWEKYTWEFFCVYAPGSVSDSRDLLAERKRSRNWTGINWTGESSTLSGTDAIAWPELGYTNPTKTQYQDNKAKIKKFYEDLSKELGLAFIEAKRLTISPKRIDEQAKQFGEAILDPTEELNVPELTKRLITHCSIVTAVASNLKADFRKLYSDQELPASAFDNLDRFCEKVDQDLDLKSFRELNRLKRDGSPQYWTAWFQGDGDNAGKYLKSFRDASDEAERLTAFSQKMREWGDYFKRNEQAIFTKGDVSGRMIYAGGDDFLGVLYKAKEQILPQDCFSWFRQFYLKIWNNPDFWQCDSDSKPINVSVGCVWAAPHVPQRDVLQHCRLAEKSAKNRGRGRIAFRILFNSGSHLEWVCPWWILEGNHLDISRNQLQLSPQNAWTHFYNDVAVLESRHAFRFNPDDEESFSSPDIARSLLRVYFGDSSIGLLHGPCWWNSYDNNELPVSYSLLGKFDKSLLGKPEKQIRVINQALNSWVINLAKVGFYLQRLPTSSERQLDSIEHAA